MAFGPLFTATRHEEADDGYVVAGRDAMAINTGLRRLGVRTVPPSIDEFGTAGLDRHRWTDEWPAPPP